MTYLLAGLALLVAYYALCAYVVYGRGPFGFAYNPVMAWIIRRLGMAAMTVGSTAYVARRLYLLAAKPGMKLWNHEHVHYVQWHRHPFSFAPRYLWYLAKQGYRNHPDEVQARKAE